LANGHPKNNRACRTIMGKMGQGGATDGVEERKTDDTAKTKQNTEGGTPNPQTPPHIIKMELCKMAEA
jgi:hypothetical protein